MTGRVGGQGKSEEQERLEKGRQNEESWCRLGIERIQLREARTWLATFGRGI